MTWRPRLAAGPPGENLDSVRLQLDGYGAPDAGISMERALVLDKQRHRALVRDSFHGPGEHHFRIPFHLAPGLAVRSMDDGRWRIENGDRVFTAACLESGHWAGPLGMTLEKLSRAFDTPAPRGVIVDGAKNSMTIAPNCCMLTKQHES